MTNDIGRALTVTLNFGATDKPLSVDLLPGETITWSRKDGFDRLTVDNGMSIVPVTWAVEEPTARDHTDTP